MMDETGPSPSSNFWRTVRIFPFILRRPQLDKRALLEHFDLVTLALDEIIDRG